MITIASIKQAATETGAEPLYSQKAWREMVTVLLAHMAQSERELDDWNSLFKAITMGDMPEEFKRRSRVPELWPNRWHQDCAAVAYFAKRLLAGIEDYRRQRDDCCNALRDIMNQLRAEAGDHAFAYDSRWEELAANADYAIANVQPLPELKPALDSRRGYDSRGWWQRLIGKRR